MSCSRTQHSTSGESRTSDPATPSLSTNDPLLDVYRVPFTGKRLKADHHRPSRETQFRWRADCGPSLCAGWVSYDPIHMVSSIEKASTHRCDDKLQKTFKKTTHFLFAANVAYFFFRFYS